MLRPEQADFLTTMSNYGALKRAHAFQIYEEICTAMNLDKPNEESFNRTIEEINAQIADYDQKLSNFCFNLKGAETGEYLVFAMTNESASDIHQHNFNEGEIDFFRILLRRIMESEENGLSSIEGLNLTSEVIVKPVSKVRAEQLIEKWIATGYLVSVRSHYYLGPRGLVEFSAYLRQHFKELMKFCEICKAVIFWGLECSHCGADIHKECMDKYLDVLESCPKCKEKWESTE